MRAATALLLALLISACDPAEEGVEASNAWVRVPPPGAMALAGYLELHNHGPDTATLAGARSDAFGHVMLHDTVIEDGVAQMVHADTVALTAGETVSFAPGGRHLMLMRPQRELAVGDSVVLVLEFADGRELPVSAVVADR